MEPIYTTQFEITDNLVDCFGRLKPSQILFFAQEMGGRDCLRLSVGYDFLAGKRLFWAVVRHRVQITRLPRSGETLRVETWALPTTRAAYPRSVIGYDEGGNECFRAITLWVLMDMDTRNMILPGKSGISVVGTVRGNELAVPGSLMPRATNREALRTVAFCDLDRNGHMNNTRCLDWCYDLLPSSFHSSHNVKEFTVCYLAEAKEGTVLRLQYDLPEEDTVQVDAYDANEKRRVFSVKLLFD